MSKRLVRMGLQTN